MPFINSKITVKLSEEKKEEIKSALGKAIALINKPENFLMVGFEDSYDLYMGGSKLEKGAYVNVSLFGKASPEAYEKMTAEICKIYEEKLSIPSKSVYITYTEVDNWGWNGRNF